MFSNKGNTLNQTCLKMALKLIVRDTHQLVNELWPPLGVGIYAPNLETKTLGYVYMHLYIYVSIDTYPTCHPNLNKTRFTLIFSS
jgi:hypothetical protein